MLIVHLAMKDEDDLAISAVPSFSTTLETLLIELIIPLLSSLGPILLATSKDLNKCLDRNKSDNFAQSVEVL